MQCPQPRLRSGCWLDGMVLRALEAHQDVRGSFCEVFSCKWGLPLQPQQWSVVRSQPRCLRGMYLHRRHDEGLVLLAGRALIGLHDLRAGSPTEGRSCLLELSAETPDCLVFPRGIAHGWYFPEGGAHLQAVSEPYADYHADDNLRCHWADPALDLPWPDPEPVLLPEAADFPSLDALRARLVGG